MIIICCKNAAWARSIKLSVQYGSPWNDQRRNEGANEGDRDHCQADKSTQLCLQWYKSNTYHWSVCMSPFFYYCKSLSRAHQWCFFLNLLVSLKTEKNWGVLFRNNSAIHLLHTSRAFIVIKKNPTWNHPSDPPWGVWQSIRCFTDQHFVERIPPGKSTLQSTGTFDSTFWNHLKINCPPADIIRRFHRCCHQWIDIYELWNTKQTSSDALKHSQNKEQEINPHFSDSQLKALWEQKVENKHKLECFSSFNTTH